MLTRYHSFFGAAFWNHLIIVLTRIEGKEKERYAQRGKAAELQQLVQAKYGLDAQRIRKVPVLAVGCDSFRECVGNIRHCVMKLDKFECSSFRSPIDELRDELDLLIDSMDDFGANLIEDAEENIRRIDDEIGNVGKKMQNPSQIPIVHSGIKSVKKTIKQTFVSYIQ